MQTTYVKVACVVLTCIVAGALRSARAEDACVDFKWDVRKERALFAAAPAYLQAGRDAASAPAIAPNHLYKLHLLPQDKVAFANPPTRRNSDPGSFAGLAALTIPAPGSYRIAIDLPSWIDVVANGSFVPAQDFEGQHACSAPHKIVEFELSGTQPFVLQFSNAVSDSVLLTVTATPARKF